MDAKELLVSLGYSTAYWGPHASTGEWAAAKALTKANVSQVDLVMALCSLDRDLMQGIADYSHAAANTDRARIALEQARSNQEQGAEIAVRRAVREEGEKLDYMLSEEANKGVSLRELLLARLNQAGVKCPTFRADVLKSYDCLQSTIRSAQTYRGLIERYRREGKNIPIIYQEEMDRLSLEMTEAGITRW